MEVDLMSLGFDFYLQPPPCFFDDEPQDLGVVDRYVYVDDPPLCSFVFVGAAGPGREQ